MAHELPESFEIRMPFDGHLHARQNRFPLKTGGTIDLMDAVLPFTARQFWGGVTMTNTRPPATTPEMVRAYAEEIRDSARRAGLTFEPVVPMFLTKDTKPEDVLDDAVRAIKYMPEGGTTNAMSGLSSLKPAYPVMEACQKKQVRVLVHGEVTDPHEGANRLEGLFIARELRPLLDNFPDLFVCLEHVTTADGVDFVKKMAPRHAIRASITPQHLHETIYSLVRKNGKNGLWRELYCLPVYKDERDCGKLRAAAAMEPELFFAGTDTALHLESAKEARGCCAGTFSSVCAMEMYLKLFEAVRVSDTIERLERFASITGPEFYGLKPSDRKLRFTRKEWTVPDSIPLTAQDVHKSARSSDIQHEVVPYKCGETLDWKAEAVL